MKDKSHSNRVREGATLLVVMLVMVICMAAVSSVLFCTGSQMQRSWKQVQLEQAFYLAEAGVEHAAAYVLSVGGGLVESTTISGTIGEGRYETQVVASDLGWNGQAIEVRSRGVVKGVSRDVQVRGLRNMSWAQYALWYDREALSLVIAAGDRFRGQVYSRPQLRFTNVNIATQGQARFYERVWTVADSIQCDSGANPVFDKGLVTGAHEQNMASVDLAALKAVAQNHAGGLLLKGDAKIELRGTTMFITNVERGWENQVVAIPTNGVVYAESYTYTEMYYDRYNRRQYRTVTEPGNIDISAPQTFSGNLTLIAENNINIVGHVRYGRDPLTDPASTDSLGLIAKKNAVVEAVAPNNLEIYAHIICRDGGFGVKNYDRGSFRGTLKVVGGIANLIRNAVGTTSPSGYLKNYIFDSRLTRNPPPFYPRLPDRLQWDTWEG